MFRRLFFDISSHFQPLQIKSVICKEGLKGYIYVEAFKQTHVKQAIEGVGALRMGLWTQQVIYFHRGLIMLNL